LVFAGIPGYVVDWNVYPLAIEFELENGARARSKIELEFVDWSGAMARAGERLSAVSLKKLAAQKGAHADGNGLYLRVNPDAGQCSWVLRYMLHGKARWMGIGAYPLISLADARARAADARRLLVDKLDPIAARKQKQTAAKLEAAKRVTFAECAARYIAAHEKEWRNAKHRQQWESTLKTYVYPIIGTLPVVAIDTALVKRVLDPIWNEKPETAKRLRGRVEAILDYATVAEYRVGPNPARWRGHLSHMFAKPSMIRPVQHHAALPYTHIPDFMAELRKQEPMAARALEFLILTATRTGEVLGARWSEIRLTDKLWTIPAGRMKGGKEHVVPLSSRAVEILIALKAEGYDTSGYLFPGRNEKKPLSNMAFLMLMRRMGRHDLTAHGFRSTFRDWVGDRSAFDTQTIEFALAHGIGDKTQAAYRRGTALEKRRQLMAHWADYCASSANTRSTNVVPLREATS
jgi:integrase